MSTKPFDKVDIDLWTFLTINGYTGTMWFRIGGKQNDQIHHALRP